jgi:glycosyltransferase involved in cell wall biosynthesis
MIGKVLGFLKTNSGAAVLFRKSFLVLRSKGLKFFYQKLLNVAYSNPKLRSNSKDNPYARYIEAIEPRPEDFLQLSQDLTKMSWLPKFSIVMPVYNVEEKWLRCCIESVRAQIYQNWELCIADDCSTDKHIRIVLDEYSRVDSRIKVIYRTENGHIVKATNTALELATGDYMCLMDNDDEIPPHALFEFAKILNEDPSVDMIYSDEDKKNLDGVRYDPFFKPDWSPEALEGCMYTAHFACYRMSIVKELGGFRVGFEGAQDYDFVLRFTELAKKISHVPKILYHWRAIPGSTAASMGEKNYVVDAGVRALQDRVQRLNGSGKVNVGKYVGSFDVRYDIKENDLVSIIILSKQVELTINAVRSVYSKNSYKNFEIVIVGKTPLSQEMMEALKPYKYKYLCSGENHNVSKGMNLGAQEASGKYLLFLNEGIQALSEDWLEYMLQIAQRDSVGVVGAKLRDENSKLKHAGIVFKNGLPAYVFDGYPEFFPGYYFSCVTNRNYLAVDGSALMTSKAIFNSVSGFDEAFSTHLYDVDFCLKVHVSGKRIVYAAQAELLLHKGNSGDVSMDDRENKLFQQKWSHLVNNDPYYNNLFDHKKTPSFNLRQDWSIKIAS